MPSKLLHTPAKLSIVPAMFMALTACGTNRTVVCNPPLSSSSSATCGCACPVHLGPQVLYATTSAGQILAFSIDQNNSGALTSIGSVPGPSVSLGLASVSGQFLYASDPHNSEIDGYSINQTTGALTALPASPFSTGTLSSPGVLAAPPQELGESPQNSLLYAADSGTIDMFTISTAGVPMALSGPPNVLRTTIHRAASSPSQPVPLERSQLYPIRRLPFTGKPLPTACPSASSTTAPMFTRLSRKPTRLLRFPSSAGLAPSQPYRDHLSQREQLPPR